MAKERRGIHLIAELAHVSIGTVDRALHGRAGINDDTRQRILQIARQVGYAPNLAARALSVAKANTKIGVCVPREIHFFYDQLWSGILEEARQEAERTLQSDPGLRASPPIRQVLEHRWRGRLVLAQVG